MHVAVKTLQSVQTQAFKLHVTESMCNHHVYDWVVRAINSFIQSAFQTSQTGGVEVHQT